MMLIYLAIGYAACVIFPMPWLSPYIIGVWGKLLGLVETEVEKVETLVEGKNAGTVVVANTVTVAANTVPTANVVVANTTAATTVAANTAAVANTK